MIAFSLQRILPLLLASALFCGSVLGEEGTDKLSAAELEKLDSLRLDYDLARGNLGVKQWVEPMEKLRSAYKAKMKRLLDKFSRGGDLAKSLAARNASKTDPTAATIHPDVKEIAEVQQVFIEAQNKLQKRLDESLAKLARSYATQLITIKGKLTKAKRLDSAILVDESIQKLIVELGLRTIEDLRKPSLSSGGFNKSKLGLVAYYPFNGNARDESGNRNDAEVNGATLTTDRHGKPSSAYSFDGKDDYIQTDTFNVLMDEFTYSIWVRPAVHQLDQNFGTLISRETVPSDNRNLQWLGLGLKGNYLRFHTAPTSQGVNDWIDTPRRRFTQDQWLHLIVTFDGTTGRIYLDGQLIASQPSPQAATSTSYNFRLGADNTGSPECLSGQIDDVRIYNRALSAKEVSAIYDSEKP